MSDPYTDPAGKTPGRVVLEPLMQDGMGVVEELAMDTATISRARLRGASLTTPPETLADAWMGVYCQYVVRYRTTRTALGLVTAYDANLRSGHVHLSVMALRRWQRTGLVLAGAGLALHQLLTDEPFRKVYLDVAEYNIGQFKLSHPFQLEASLPQAFYFDGRYWDRLIFSISRSEFARSSLKDGANGVEYFDRRALERVVPVPR